MTLRVLTWNVWWRFGPWMQRQDAILQTLRAENADVICLQEVWATEEGEDQVANLADALGYASARSPAPFWEGVSFSNAILSRWPILDASTRVLHDEQGKPSHRTALHASIAAPFGSLETISTHLEFRFDRSGDRTRQTRDVAQFVKDVRGDPTTGFPVIVGGDFNASPHSDELRHLLGTTKPAVDGVLFHDVWALAGDGSTGNTWSRDNPHLADATWPDRRLDYLFVSWPRPKPLGQPLRCWLSGVEPVNGVVPSDHYAVVADLRTS